MHTMYPSVKKKVSNNLKRLCLGSKQQYYVTVIYFLRKVALKDNTSPRRAAEDKSCIAKDFFLMDHVS